MKPLFVLPLVATLAACTSSNAGSSGPSTGGLEPKPGSQGCNTLKAQFAVGQPRGEAIFREAMESAGAKTIRVIPHGLSATMEYVQDRLSIELDANGNISRVFCG